LKGSTSGLITLVAPAVAGTNTVTVPARTGNIAIDGPTFAAYGSLGQTIAPFSAVKVNFNQTLFDTGSGFNTGLNRFVAPVAGYYQINATIGFGSTNGEGHVYIYKNGSLYASGTCFTLTSPSGNGLNGSVSAVVNLNATDYVEIFAFQTSGGNLNVGCVDSAQLFTGCFLRAL